MGVVWRKKDVQWKQQLIASGWTPLNSITASGSTASFSETPSQAAQFYRVAQ
jgi:hypothetical protein